MKLVNSIFSFVDLCWNFPFESLLYNPPYAPPQVTRLMERVEAAFAKHFVNGNRRKGMDTLRPKTRRERHRITFFSGK